MFEHKALLFLSAASCMFLYVEIFYLRKLRYLFFGEELKLIKKKQISKVIFYLIAFLFLVAALAGPRFRNRKTFSVQTNTEVFFLLDTSRSMDVSDTIKSRLALSKAMILILNQKMETIRRGLIFFKGSSILSIPLTLDKTVFDSALENISSQSLTSSGTNIEQAMKLAIKNFSKKNSVQKIIVLFTDGDETLGNLKKIAAEMRDKNIVCICIGVGTHAGTEIKVYDEHNNKKSVITKLYEESLKNFIHEIKSDKSFYIKYDAVNAVDIVYEKIAELDSNEGMMSAYEKINDTSYFLCAALVFLLFGFVYGEHLWKK